MHAPTLFSSIAIIIYILSYMLSPQLSTLQRSILRQDFRPARLRSYIATAFRSSPLSNDIGTAVTTTETMYRIAALDNLAFGKSLVSDTVAKEKVQLPRKISQGWVFAPGLYTAKQVVNEVAPLLDSLVTQLGPDSPGSPPARKLLIDGLQQCLSLNSRESTLQLQTDGPPSSRKEFAIQASKIGEMLIGYVKSTPQRETDPRLVIRSPCEGHLWTSSVVSLMRGPRSNGMLMQLYNEWLHQMTLLRDTLLPFENFSEVQLVFKENAPRGLRPMESPRSNFLFQLMTAQIKRATILDVAKVFTAPDLPSGGYGFQYSRGIVMPASLFTGGSTVLLRYQPALIQDNAKGNILFSYTNDDYYSVPRSDIEGAEKSLAPAAPKLNESALAVSAIGGEPSSISNVSLKGSFESGASFSVDIGQSLRGLRYAYRAGSSGGGKAGEVPEATVHHASAVLQLDDLVSSQQSGVHIIYADSPVTRLALLGKIYPENIVLVDSEEDLSEAMNVGKGFGPKFVIIGGQMG